MVLLVYARGYLGVVGIPRTDQAVFLLEGKAILQGKTPYIDLWDHKGPLLYFLNAFGLVLGGGNRIGVWLLEMAMACFAYGFAYRALVRRFGRIAAFSGVAIALLMSATCLNDGNLSESWGLLFALFMIPLVDRYFARGASGLVGRMNWPALGIGACGAVEILLRPNLCGTFLAALLTICIFGWRSREFMGLRRGLLFIGLGVAVVLAPVLLYLGAKGALGAFWDCYITYNQAYVSGSVSSQRVSLEGQGSRLATFLYGFFLWKIAPIAVLGWLLAARDTFKFISGKTIEPLVLFGLISMPIEMIASCISRFMFEHYFMLWGAPFTILITLLVARIEGLEFLKLLWSRLVVVGASLAGVGFLFLNVQTQTYDWILHPGAERDKRLSPGDYAVTDYILSSTSPTDPVFLWGLVVNLNYYTGRPLATRYLSQMPLTTPGYASNAIYEKFDEDLRKSRPAVIIDTRGDFAKSILSAPFPAARDVADFIVHNYRPVQELKYGEPVFQRVDPQ